MLPPWWHVCRAVSTCSCNWDLNMTANMATSREEAMAHDQTCHYSNLFLVFDDEMNHYHCSMKEHNLASAQVFPCGDWSVIASEDRLCIQSTMQLSAFGPPCWKAWGLHKINRDKLITTLANGNSVFPELLWKPKLQGSPHKWYWS